MTDRRRPIRDYYYGSTVDQYEQERAGTKYWLAEQTLAREFLATLPDGARVLDVPVGTGRFFEFYADGRLAITAVDVSEDMLKKARARGEADGAKAAFLRGSVFELPCADDQFDAVLSFRLLTWFNLQEVDTALKELARASQRSVLVTAHVRVPMWRAFKTRSLRRMLKRLRKRVRYRRQGLVHSRNALLALFSKHGLTLCSEHVLREVRGVRQSRAWLLTKASPHRD